MKSSYHASGSFPIFLPRKPEGGCKGHLFVTAVIHFMVQPGVAERELGRQHGRSDCKNLSGLLQNTDIRLAYAAQTGCGLLRRGTRAQNAHTAALLRALRGDGVPRSTPPHTWKMWGKPQPCAVTVRPPPLTPCRSPARPSRTARVEPGSLGQGRSRSGGAGPP